MGILPALSEKAAGLCLVFFVCFLFAGGKTLFSFSLRGHLSGRSREPLLSFVARQRLRLNYLARAIEAYLGWSQ